MQQLGKALTSICAAARNLAEMADDIDAVYAPASCYKPLVKAYNRKARIARRHVKALTGLTEGQLLRKARAMVGEKVLQKAMQRLSASRHPCA